MPPGHKGIVSIGAGPSSRGLEEAYGGIEMQFSSGTV